jgi:hypothetical protein
MNKQERIIAAVTKYRKCGGQDRNLAMQICAAYELTFTEFYRALYTK